MITNTEKQTPTIAMAFPGAIEAQEAKGQRELVNSSQLPRHANPYSGINAKEQYGKMGIEVVGESQGDDLFFDVILPAGWKLEPTDHSMWSHLVDGAGTVKAMIFYKAASYDRRAHIDFK